MRGCVDAFGENYVNGWAYDPESSPAVIEVSLNNRVVAKGLANEFRRDLVPVTGHQKGLCAFHVLVPIRFSEVDLSKVTIKANGKPIHLWAEKAKPKPALPMPTSVISDEFLPVDLPVPDAELVFLVSGHRRTDEFAAGRRATALRMRAMLRENGIVLGSFKTILDFGCGCGRILAGWQHMLSPDVEVHGVDINEQLIAFCQQAIPFAVCSVSPYSPPLNYVSGKFDFVYAGSVFTHLTEEAAAAWGEEFSRLIRPGGIAFVSSHGTFYAKILAELSREGYRELEERGIYVHLHQTAGDVWLGHNSYSTYMTSTYFRSLFKRFELVRIYPGISHGPNPFASYQDILILRRLTGC